MQESIVQSISNIFSAILGALITLCVFRIGKKSEVSRERLDRVYSILFQTIEPYLYQNLPLQECDKIVSALNEIVDAGGILSSPSLRHKIKQYLKHPRHEISNYQTFQYSLYADETSYLTQWYEICSEIDNTYDLLCKNAMLPVRSLSYRINYRQYINRLQWLLHTLIFLIPYISLLIFVSMFVFLVPILSR